MEVVRVQTKQLRGLREAALGLLERLEDELLLRITNRLMVVRSAGKGASGIGQCFGQILRENVVRRSYDKSAFDRVFELPDIPWPVIGSQRRASCGRQPLDPAVRTRSIARDEMVGEQGDVLGTLAQGWHGNGNNVQPVEQIKAEFFFANGLLKILVGRSDEADIQFERPRSANTHKFPLLQHTKQLGLDGGGHFGDLVEEHGAVLGNFEEAFLLRYGAREGAAFVSEKF